MAHPQSVGRVEGGLPSRQKTQHSLPIVPGEHFGRDYWSIEPDVGRVAHGVPARVDRLRGLGNAVVPAATRKAFQRLMGLV